MIELKEIGYDTLKEVIEIYDTLSDGDKKHVAPNIYSLAEAYINHSIAWPRAIMLNKEVIGFVMLGLDNYMADEHDWPVYYLWRFMIASEFQGQGYGKQVLDLIVQKCKEEERRYLYVSCTRIDPMPYEMYIKYGFIDTGKVEEGEQVLKLKIE